MARSTKATTRSITAADRSQSVTTPFNFGPAAPDEDHVFGARRPGYHLFPPEDDGVEDWIEFVRDRDVGRVCCLLEDALDEYDDLLGRYRTVFGAENVLHAPNTDHTPLSVDLFRGEILPFLREGAAADERTVVHCSAGVGRTGQVLVGWLCRERGYEPDVALFTVQAGTAASRDPIEAADRRHLRRLCAAGD